MDDDKKKDWEKRLTAEIQELSMIQSDIKALREFLVEKRNEVKRQEWILDPVIREEAYQLAQYVEKYRTIDGLETNLLPTPRDRGPDFDQRLREIMDVDKHIEQSE